MNDELEQAFREGFIKGKSEDSRIIRIANHYGYTAQSDIMIEECGELTQAICKLRRAWSDDRLANVKEELADVLIMARQLRVMLGADDVDRIISSKLDRQIERIEDEKRTAENICTCYRDGRCWGTKDMKKCECGGNEKICDFYPTKRNKDEST